MIGRVKQQIDRPSDGPTEGPTNWLYQPIHWPTNWMTKGATRQPTNRQTDWSIDQPTNELFDSVTHWLTHMIVITLLRSTLSYLRKWFWMNHYARSVQMRNFIWSVFSCILVFFLYLVPVTRQWNLDNY